jgi:hypothetical protein
VRRIGQTRPVTSIWMCAFELDKQIDTMLEKKNMTSSTVLSSKATTNNDAEDNTPKLSIMKLLQSVLPPPDKKGGLKQTSILNYSQGNSASMKK